MHPMLSLIQRLCTGSPFGARQSITLAPTASQMGGSIHTARLGGMQIQPMEPEHPIDHI